MPYKNPEARRQCNKKYYNKHKKEIKAYQNAHKKEKKEYDRIYSQGIKKKTARHKYAQSEKGKESIRKLSKKHREQKPEQTKAISILNHAKRDGKIKQQPCVVCGALKVEAHHEDYDKPLDVIWLCRKHHVEKHRGKQI